MKIEKEIRDRLFELQDLEYRDFHSRLMPTVDKELVIGVRTPALRKLAKELAKEEEYMDFLSILPHKYYEENNLHGFLLEGIRDYKVCVERLNQFLPFVDNWATCDMMSPKIFKKHKEELLMEIQRWLASEHTYTIRYGINMLMTHYLDEDFKEEYLQWVAKLHSGEYYVNMMIAWYFATALAKQRDSAISYIEERRLEPWTHNKAIQKAVESRRISPEDKLYLKSLKIK